jgi:hypothetical protein
MTNLNLITHTPHFRVRLVSHLARMLGILIHVEGIPFGSDRCVRPWQTDATCGARQ